MSASSRPARFRPARPGDLRPAYGVFRRALADYLTRIGQGDPMMSDPAEIEAAWVRQRPWMEHLEASAAEHWVAVDADEATIGWALSTEHDGLLELAMFFVEPTLQARGTGRALLERAFPAGRGRHRVIVATLDPSALGLYLRSGVAYQTTAVDLIVRPSAAQIATDLAIDPVDPLGPDAVDAIGSIVELERSLIGHARPGDHAFLSSADGAGRPAWIARRDGRAVGFAYGVGANGYSCGPIGARERRDLPALLATVEADAAARSIEEFAFTLPLAASTAVDHLLARGARFDPFYVTVLTDGAWLPADRWVLTGPGFVI